jgi:glycosyltransferase involved in cell wall biosynthesis
MISGKTVGLAISSYITNQLTLQSLSRCIASLATHHNSLDSIYVIDDGSPYRKACEFYRRVLPPVKVVYQCQNRGIAVTKNHSLKLLQEHDIIIMADNDIEFQTHDWDVSCVNRMITAGIPSMAMSGVMGHLPYQIKDHNGIKVNYHHNHQGALIFATKEAVKAVGGFPVLPERYGQEHAHWQARMAVHGGHEGFVLDVGISEFVTLRNLENSFTTTADKVRMSIINADALNAMPHSSYIPIEYEDLDG